jgi:hypothetical protein
MTPPDAWRRLKDMQHVLTEQPLIAHAVRCLPCVTSWSSSSNSCASRTGRSSTIPNRCRPTSSGSVHAVADSVPRVIHQARCIEAQNFPVGNWQSRGVG